MCDGTGAELAVPHRPACVDHPVCAHVPWSAGSLCFENGVDIVFGVFAIFGVLALILNAIMSSVSHAADIKSSSALSRPHAYLEILNALNVLLLVVPSPPPALVDCTRQHSTALPVAPAVAEARRSSIQDDCAAPGSA